MKRNHIAKAMFIVATATCVALGARQAGAMGGANGSQSGDLAASASPYALLAPVTVAQTPGGEGRAAFDGNSSTSAPSPCPPGMRLIASPNGRWRCMANH